MAKKIIENWNLNVSSVSNVDTGDDESLRQDTSRYEDLKNAESIFNTNSGKQSETPFKDMSFKLKRDNIDLKINPLAGINDIVEKRGIELEQPNITPEKKGVNVRNMSQIYGRLIINYP